MIFSELYSAYYSAVAKVLRAAVEHPVGGEELRGIIEKNAFRESVLLIEPALREERWQLLRSDGTTPIRHAPTMPLTNLQKSWLKAIFMDKRIRLFGGELPDFPEVEPLFRPEDIRVFDKYSDGDPFEEEWYIRNFRLIMDAIRKRYPLSIGMTNRNGGTTRVVLMPEYLEYSEKDDKFRLTGSGSRYGKVVNLGRITECEPCDAPFDTRRRRKIGGVQQKVEFELTDQRNALERVLMHFAHFEKQAERIEWNRYRVTLSYDRDDETELVIRILSFGPLVRVTAPQEFVELIKKRLMDQKSCGQ